MAPKINAEECTACGNCVDACPVECITIVEDVAKINAEECTDCGTCIEECSLDAISEE